jgi:tetratricopeptide (TPR) repeat protein
VLLVGRGRAHAELGDWDESGRDFAEALTILPGEVEVAHSVALVQLLRGQRDLLERTRETLVSRWATTRNPDRARWAAEAMIVAPIASAAARLQAVKWAETTLEIEPKRRERIALHGAALYRAGRFPQAVNVLERAMASDPASKSRSPRAAFLAFLALANRAIGRPAEAARWRAAALARLQELEHPAPPPDSVTGKPLISTVRAATWREREELRALLREGGAPVGPTVRSAADLPAPDAGMRSR